MERRSASAHLVDRTKLPRQFPTHLHSPAFWCSLGRAVATFGFLEKVLKQTHMAVKGTYPAPADPAEADAAVEEWHNSVGATINAALGRAIRALAGAMRDHPELRHRDQSVLIERLKAATDERNMICHGSWGPPDEHGASVAFYVTIKAGQLQESTTRVTVEWLDQLQAKTTDLACDVMDVVTEMGYRFPGRSGPGDPLL